MDWQTAVTGGDGKALLRQLDAQIDQFLIQNEAAGNPPIPPEMKAMIRIVRANQDIPFKEDGDYDWDLMREREFPIWLEEYKRAADKNAWFDDFATSRHLKEQQIEAERADKARRMQVVPVPVPFDPEIARRQQNALRLEQKLAREAERLDPRIPQGTNQPESRQDVYTDILEVINYFARASTWTDAQTLAFRMPLQMRRAAVARLICEAFRRENVVRAMNYLLRIEKDLAQYNHATPRERNEVAMAMGYLERDLRFNQPPPLSAMIDDLKKVGVLQVVDGPLAGLDDRLSDIDELGTDQWYSRGVNFLHIFFCRATCWEHVHVAAYALSPAERHRMAAPVMTKLLNLCACVTYDEARAQLTSQSGQTPFQQLLINTVVRSGRLLPRVIQEFEGNVNYVTDSWDPILALINDREFNIERVSDVAFNTWLAQCPPKVMDQCIQLLQANNQRPALVTRLKQLQEHEQYGVFADIAAQTPPGTSRSLYDRNYNALRAFARLIRVSTRNDAIRERDYQSRAGDRAYTPLSEPLRPLMIIDGTPVQPQPLAQLQYQGLD